MDYATKLFIIALIIFFGSGLIWIKISDYFLSAVDIVGHSRFSYWIRKYISGFVFGAFLAFFFLALASPGETDKTKQDTNQKSSSEQQKNETNKSQQTLSLKPIGIDCNSENKTIKIICQDKELIEINNKYQNLGSSLASRNIDAEQLKKNRAELNRKLSECNLNAQCIYFSFQEATIELENLSN